MASFVPWSGSEAALGTDGDDAAPGPATNPSEANPASSLLASQLLRRSLISTLDGAARPAPAAPTAPAAALAAPPAAQFSPEAHAQAHAWLQQMVQMHQLQQFLLAAGMAAPGAAVPAPLAAPLGFPGAPLAAAPAAPAGPALPPRPALPATAAAAGAFPPESYLTPRKARKRRARIMRDGELTMIVYGSVEALTWARRISLFQDAMRDVLGDRRRTFTWRGSVTDSVVGAFLTQNVSDALSSRAYMEVAARWPAREAAAPGAANDACASGSGASGARAHDAGVTDTVDWEAVRTAPQSELAETIKCRGMQNTLAANIQAFLNYAQRTNAVRLRAVAAAAPAPRAVAGALAAMVGAVAAAAAEEAPAAPARLAELYDAASAPPAARLLSLEWLRAAPDEEAREYLMAVNGLGRKSVGCIMLLTLAKREFPVDTNVGRIAARLGWVPLDAGQAIEELDDYAPEPEVHAYLRARLLGFSVATLYELHYQMITLGKVFCSKAAPNCRACPMREECEYALNNGPSLHGRKRLRVAQPAPELAPPRAWAGGGGAAGGFGGGGGGPMLAVSTPLGGAGPAAAWARPDGRPLHWKTRQRLARLERERAERAERFSTLSLEALIAETPRRPRTPALRRPRGAPAGEERRGALTRARAELAVAAAAAREEAAEAAATPRWLPVDVMRRSPRLHPAAWETGAAARRAEAPRLSLKAMLALEQDAPPWRPLSPAAVAALAARAEPAAFERRHEVPPPRPHAAPPALPPLLSAASEGVGAPLSASAEPLTPPSADAARNASGSDADGASPSPSLEEGPDEPAEGPVEAAVEIEIDVEVAAALRMPPPPPPEAMEVDEELSSEEEEEAASLPRAARAPPAPLPAAPATAAEVAAEVARLSALGAEMAAAAEAVAVAAARGDARVHRERLLELALAALGIDAALTVASAGAVVAAARRRYHRLAMAIHPDKCALPGAEAAFAAAGRAMSAVGEHGAAFGTAADAALAAEDAAGDAAEGGGGGGGAAAGDKALGHLHGGAALLERVAWTQNRLVLHARVIPPELHASLPRHGGYLPEPGGEGADEPLLFIPLALIPTLDARGGPAPRPDFAAGEAFVPPAAAAAAEEEDGDAAAVRAALGALVDCVCAAAGEAGPSSFSAAATAGDGLVEGVLLVAARAALRGRFPLNGTYFQINEAFADATTVEAPAALPAALLAGCASCAVHFGLGIHFMTKAMTQPEVAHMFASGWVCFRAFDPRTRAPRPLPAFLVPTVPNPAKKTVWRNKDERAADRAAKAARRGVALPPTSAWRAGGPAAVRAVRAPLGPGDLAAPPPTLVDGAARAAGALEGPLTPEAAWRRAGVAGAGGAAAAAAARRFELPRFGAPGQPRSLEAALNKSGRGRTRVNLFPIVRSTARCGVCKACLNPGWKKACDLRRREMLAAQAEAQAARAQAQAQAGAPVTEAPAAPPLPA